MRQQVQGMKDFDGFYRSVSGVSFEEEGDGAAMLREAASWGGLWERLPPVPGNSAVPSRAMHVSKTAFIMRYIFFSLERSLLITASLPAALLWESG